MNDIHYLIISSFEETVSLKWGITYISFDDLMHSDTRSKFKMFLFKVDDIKCFQDIVSFLISGGGGEGSFGSCTLHNSMHHNTRNKNIYELHCIGSQKFSRYLVISSFMEPAHRVMTHMYRTHDAR